MEEKRSPSPDPVAPELPVTASTMRMLAFDRIEDDYYLGNYHHNVVDEAADDSDDVSSDDEIQTALKQMAGIQDKKTSKDAFGRTRRRSDFEDEMDDELDRSITEFAAQHMGGASGDEEAKKTSDQLHIEDISNEQKALDEMREIDERRRREDDEAEKKAAALELLPYDVDLTDSEVDPEMPPAVVTDADGAPSKLVYSCRRGVDFDVDERRRRQKERRERLRRTRPTEAQRRRDLIKTVAQSFSEMPIAEKQSREAVAAHGKKVFDAANVTSADATPSTSSLVSILKKTSPMPKKDSGTADDELMEVDGNVGDESKKADRVERIAAMSKFFEKGLKDWEQSENPAELEVPKAVETEMKDVQKDDDVQAARQKPKQKSNVETEKVKEEEEENPIKKAAKDREKQVEKNDDLLYDDEEDEDNERWVQERRRKKRPERIVDGRRRRRRKGFGAQGEAEQAATGPGLGRGAVVSRVHGRAEQRLPAPRGLQGAVQGDVRVQLPTRPGPDGRREDGQSAATRQTTRQEDGPGVAGFETFLITVMAASIGRMKWFRFSVTVSLLLYVVNCTEIPEDCCVHEGLTEKSVIEPSCTDICVFGGGVNLSDCSSISAKKIVQNLVVADFVMISNCNDTALFPKLNTLNPVGEGYAIQMTNCNSSTNTTSFGSLESIAIDVLDRKCGNWDTIIDYNNTELYPAVLSRIQTIAQQALFVCQPIDHAVAGPIVETLYRLLIYPNTTFLGYPVIFYEEHYYPIFACFLLSGVTTLFLVFGVPTYISFDLYRSRAVKKELRVTTILLACVSFFRPHGDNIIRSMRSIDTFCFVHDFRMLKLLSFAKFLAWSGNAQEEYDQKKQLILNARITEICEDAVDEIEQRVVLADPTRKYAARLQHAIGEVTNGLEDKYNVTSELNKESHNARIFVNNAVMEAEKERKQREAARAKEERKAAGGNDLPKLVLDEYQQQAQDVLDQPPTSERANKVFSQAPTVASLKRIPAIIKDDEEDLEEIGDIIESGLCNLSALSRRAEANKKEAGPVAERRFEREWATTAFYEDVICAMKVRGDKINPYYMPPVARESRNMVMIDKLIRRMSGQKYVLADVDMPSELSRSLVFDTIPETIARNPKEAADQFWKRLERTMQDELNNFRVNCMAGDRLPENKAVAARIAMARDTKEKRLVRELEGVKRVNARFASQTLAEVVYEDDEEEKKKDGKKEAEKPGRETKKVEETKAKVEPKKMEKTVSAAPTVACMASKASPDAKKKAVNVPEQKKKTK